MTLAKLRNEKKNDTDLGLVLMQASADMEFTFALERIVHKP